MSAPPLLAVHDLVVRYPGDPATGAPDRVAVDGVSVEVRRGEIVCLVGESGAGKSTVGSAALGLLDRAARVDRGRIELDGVDLLTADEPALRALRGRRIGAIFQDPLSALNPVLSIGRQMVPAIRHATGLSARAARAKAVELLDAVAIPEPARRLRQYPHELSGGMRQRVVVAIAIAGEPDLLIADEPTTALDVSIQSELLGRIRALARERNIGVVLVTHDMAVVAGIADRVVVMRHGRVVERGETQRVLFAPEEAYTRELIAAVPLSDRKMARFGVGSEGSTRATDPAPMTGHAAVADPASAGPTDAAHDPGALLSLRGVTVEFAAPRTLRAASRAPIRAMDAVDLEVRRGEALGIVGESGSGKSTLARAACGLQPIGAGSIRYDGIDVTGLAHDRALRRRVLSMQMIFQDPFASLNPRQRVLDALVEPQAVLGRGTRASRRARALAALESVGLDPDAASRHPHAFSGGQRQRVSIARALVLEPRLLICDEPTSALDVSVQARVLDLLVELRRRLDLTLLFISHDLAVVRQLSDRIAVMHRGRVVEIGDAEALFEAPEHPYTRRLMALTPRFAPDTPLADARAVDAPDGDALAVAS